MSTTATPVPELTDELLCIADFKLVLGGWYMVVLPNGRSIGDWCALCGMLQDQYGHARAIYRYLATAGVPEPDIDPAREASAIRGPSILDASPSSWADFVATAFLAELMVDHQLQAIATAVHSPEPRLALLAKKMLRESRFHQSYLTGWLRNLLTTNAEATTKALTSRFDRAKDWWPSAAGTDPAHDAGYRMRDTEIRDGYIAAINEVTRSHGVPDLVANVEAGSWWDRAVRRGDGLVGIPPNLHEAIRFRNLELAIT